LVLSVFDTGVGIKVKDQTKLFKFFGTVKSTRKVNTKGVGLGLSITKMICEEFGGGVAIHSKKGIGSVFQAQLKILPKMVTEINKTTEEAELAEILQKVRARQLALAQENFKKAKPGKVMS